MRYFVCLFLLMLLSCESSYDFKNVNYTYLFDDNSSKVWLIDRVVQNELVISQFNQADKDVIIFHKNSKYQFAPIKSLGKSGISTGEFSVNSQKLELTLWVDSISLEYDLVHLSEDSILMNRREKDSLPAQKLKLIPLPLL